MTILYQWGPLWAILGHYSYWPFWVILGPVWSLFRAYFSPVWLPKITWMAPNIVQWDMVWSYCTSGGLWGAIFGHFGVVLGPIVSGWGLFGAYFSPLWLPKTTWIAPNLVQCERAWPWPYCTSGGHFGPFRSDFRAQSKRLGPVCSLFLTRLATQNDLNGPKSGTVGQGMTIMYWWGPLWAFFWTLWAILEWF